MDPRRVHEPGLLRQPRLRHRGGGADVLLEAGARADARPVGAARRPAAGAVALRPVPAPRARRSPGATRCCARCSNNGDITSSQYANAVAQAPPPPQGRTPLHAHPRAVLLQLRARAAAVASTARTPCARAASRSTRRSTRGCSASPSTRSSGRFRTPTDPAAAIVSINPSNGAIRAMTAVSPGEPEEPVQLRLARAPPARLDVQDVRADDGDLAGHEPRHDHVPLGAVQVRPDRDRIVRHESADRVVSADLRPHVPRADVDRERRRCAPTTPSTRG